MQVWINIDKTVYIESRQLLVLCWSTLVDLGHDKSFMKYAFCAPPMIAIAGHKTTVVYVLDKPLLKHNEYNFSYCIGSNTSQNKIALEKRHEAQTAASKTRLIVAFTDDADEICKAVT